VRKSRYSDEQIAAALRQAEIGTPVADRLKQIVADLTLDRHVLQDVLKKKW